MKLNVFFKQVCIQYCVENGFDEAESLARLVNEQMTLDETLLSKLINVVGKDVLK